MEKELHFLEIYGSRYEALGTDRKIYVYQSGDNQILQRGSFTSTDSD